MDFASLLEIELSEEEITLDSFIRKVRKFNSLDLALVELPSEYIDFYSNNERNLNKQLKKLKLLESSESPGYVGFSYADTTTRKKIKYKGEIIVIEWDNENKVWIPWVSKRSIVQALRYGKSLIDDLE